MCGDKTNCGVGKLRKSRTSAKPWPPKVWIQFRRASVRYWQFADGITETLTTDLARIAHSAVIARNTAFTFKGKAVDARQIGKQLGVRYILEGSVQRSGDRIRINVQLIDAESGNHLWADRFDKTSGDLLQMQDEIEPTTSTTRGQPTLVRECHRAR